MIEIIGTLILVISILILVALISYSPDDPNFIYPENQKIKNFLGINGSISADFLLQSIGLISYFLPITLFFLSIRIIYYKTLVQVVSSLFYIVCYSLFGTIFLTQFHKEAFFLIVNGNGGFVGDYFYNKIFFDIVNLNIEISYYAQILLFIIFFLISLNFRFIWLSNIVKIFRNRKNISSIEVSKFEKEDSIKIDNIQETFSFDQKTRTTSSQRRIFNLPKLELLEEIKSKNKKNNLRNDINEEFLEKILLDFGVEGKIRKISSGPVVTLNEFEPAAGVKVSKIINLSDDIARNTSSESARISVIPGSSSVGIELPNLEEIMFH